MLGVVPVQMLLDTGIRMSVFVNSPEKRGLHLPEKFLASPGTEVTANVVEEETDLVTRLLT